VAVVRRREWRDHAGAALDCPGLANIGRSTGICADQQCMHASLNRQRCRVTIVRWGAGPSSISASGVVPSRLAGSSAARGMRRPAVASIRRCAWAVRVHHGFDQLEAVCPW